MPSARLTLQATKAAGYFDSLCRHFARKVTVEREGNQALVQFPMGECEMAIDGQRMSFRCVAMDDQALDTVKMIIASHAVRFGELREAEVLWIDG